jgi:hypothetical protein
LLSNSSYRDADTSRFRVLRVLLPRYAVGNLLGPDTPGPPASAGQGSFPRGIPYLSIAHPTRTATPLGKEEKSLAFRPSLAKNAALETAYTYLLLLISLRSVFKHTPLRYAISQSVRYGLGTVKVWYGDEGTRTPDLCRAKASLSQLSYVPEPRSVVGLARLELATSRLSGVRSIQLSYRPLHW